MRENQRQLGKWGIQAEWLISKLRWIVRGGKTMSDKAALFTALGAMLIPSAMVWVLEAPDTISSFWRWIPALVVAFMGVVFVFIGWDFVRRSEEEQRGKRTEDREQRLRDGERREKEHVEYLASLQIIAKQLGANSVRVRHQVQREVERVKIEQNRKK